MESSAKYTLVGAFVIGAFVLIVLGVLWLSNRGVGDESKFYTIYFRNQTLNGLQLNSAVTMKGIKVGVVDKLGISKKSIELVQVIVKVELETPIKSDTQAIITRNLLTGLAFIELQGSHQESPELKAVLQGETSPIIPEGKSGLDAVASSLPELMGDATEVLGRAKEILSDENVKNLNQTLKNTEQITGSIAKNSDNINELIVKSSSLATQLEKVSKNLAKFTNPADGDLAKLNTALVGGVDELKNQLKFIGEKSDQVASELKNTFRVVAQDINTATNSVGHAARSFSATAEHLSDLRSIVSGPDKNTLGPGERSIK